MRSSVRQANNLLTVLFVLVAVVGGAILSNGIRRAKAKETAPRSPLPAATCATPPAGMISWWPGEGNANDIQGSNNGTVQGSATFPAGEVGQAFSLNGSNQNIRISDSPSLRPSSLTIETWVNFNSTGTNTIFEKALGGGDDDSYVVWYESGALHGYTCSAPGTCSSILNYPWSPGSGVWHHVGYTFDGATHILYVDGAAVASGPNTVVPGYDSHDVLIGAETLAGNVVELFDGKIDEVTLYNRALTASEVQSVYNAGSAGKCQPTCIAPPSGMISWWPGENTASDIQGTNNGTLQNGATFAAGRVGQAFSLDGTNEYVLIGDPIPASLRIQNEITIDAWIYITAYPSDLGLIAGSQYDTNAAGASIFLDGRTNPDGQTAPPGHIHFQIGGDGSFHGSNANAQVPLNQWVHIAATRKANEDAKVYYNGVLQPVTSAPWSGAISYDGAWFAIGQQKDINRPFKGLIDEVEIFNRALSASEVQSISNAGSAGTCQTPSLSIGNVAVMPGTSGTTNAVFTVNAVRANASQITVDYATADGTATQPSDYALTSGTLTIPANTSSATISVPVNGLTRSSSKNFTVTLSNPSNASINRSPATGTILTGDGTKDFSTNNPNGSWSYGNTTATTAGSAFNIFDEFVLNLAPSLDEWDSSTVHCGDHTPGVYHNTSGGDLNFGSNTLAPDMLALHPGCGGQNSVIRWTAPTTGPYVLRGRFQGIDHSGTSTDVHIIKNLASTATHVVDGNINGYGNEVPFVLEVSANAGDTFDFVVGVGTGGYFNDTTALKAEFTPGNLTCDSPPSGIVSWWPGDGNATDFKGNNNGTLQGSPQAGFTAGEVGQAFSFNAANSQYVSINDSPSSLHPNNLTIDAWVNFNSSVGGGCCNSIFGKGFSGGDADSYGVWYSGHALHGETCDAASFASSCTHLDYSWDPTLGVWYHVAYTFDGGTHKLFLDGREVASGANTRVPAYDNTEVRIGADVDTGGLYLFDGRIDEVEFFNRGLSSAEIASIFNAGSAGKCKITPTGISAVSGSGSFGGTATLTATMGANGSPLSGKTVSFSLNSNSVGSATTDANGIATVSGVDLSGINAGSYPNAIVASFAGDVTYAASSAHGTLTVNKKDQAITVNTHAPATAAYNSQFTVAATSDSGLTVSYSSSGSCTNNGAVFTMTSGTGTCTVKYDRAGNGNYNPAPQITESVNAQTINQAITVGTHAPANATYNAQFTVAATSNSGLAVSYGSTGSCTNTGATFTMTSGTGTCTVKYDQAGDGNYNAASQVTESVNAQKATLTITADNKTKSYCAANPPFTYTASGFVNGDTASGVSGAPDLTTTAVTTSDVGGYSINAAPGTLSAANYAFSFANGTLTIAKATPVTNWSNPADITYGTALGSTQLNGTATNPNDSSTVNGTFTYNPVSSTVLNAGNNQTLHVDFVPDVPANYNSASKDVSINVLKANQTITVGTHAPANKVYNTSFTVAATSDSGLTVAYSSSGVCTNSGAVFTMTSGTGTCTVKYDQAGNGNYNAATQVTESVTAQKADQTITFGTIADKTFGDADFAISATASSTLGVSFAPAGQCSLSGLTVHITGAGSCGITASQAGNSNYNAAPNAPRSFNIGKAPATVTLGNLTQSADGNPKFATATTNPPSLTVVITYSQNGSPVASPANVGSYDVLATINEANYQGTTTGTLVINSKITPTINWGNPADITFGAALGATQLNATATNPNDNSAVPGSFTYNPPAATVLNAGNNQTLSASFTPNDGSTFNTNSKTVSINVLKANQTINFGALSGKTFGDADFNVSATATSGLAVSFAASGQCTITGNTVHITGAGSCTITASQAGNSNFNAATNVPQIFNIAKASQTITFGALASKTFGDADFAVNATASSGLSVSFAASGQCTISTNTVHITGGGACTITASQAGNSNFNAATNVPQAFTIAKASQTITFGALANKTFGDADFAVSATASSGLTVSFAASGQCTVNTNTVRITGTGSCTITASQSGDSNYSAAANAPQSFNIGKVDQTITFGALASKTFGDPDFAVSASSSSGLAVSFAPNGQCTISANTVHLTGAGSCTITASQAGDSTHNAATNVPQTFSVAKASQTINFGALANKTFGDAAFNVSATASSGLTVSFSILSGPATINGNTVAITGAGVVTVRASQAGDSNNNAATNVDQPFTVAKRNQTITFSALSNRTAGDPPFTVSATATPSGLPVTFSIVSGPATISGNTVTITGAGTVMVRASQSGDSNYNAATSVDQSFDVANASSLTFKPQNTYGVGSAPRGIASADFNGDGKPDLVTANADGNANSVTVLLGNGLGTFSPGVSYSVGPTNTQPDAIAVGDLNGDGKPDIVTGNFNGTISILLNNGSGVFGSLQTMQIGGVANNLPPGSIKLADFNGDGKLDLVAGSAPIAVFLGNGNGTFQSPRFITGTSDINAALAVGDFNGDGRLDIAKLASFSFMYICLGDGSGGFSATLVPRSPNALAIAAADLNGDGKLDVILGNQNPGGTANNVSVLLGKGDGTFKTAVNYNANFSKNIVVGDLNGDGKPDIVTTGGAFTIDVLLGNGDGTFKSFFSVPLISAQQLQSPQAVTLGDFNRNGMLDIAAATQDTSSNGSAVVFLDNLPPTQTPTGNGISVQQGGVNLNFSGVNTAGTTTATPINPNAAGTLTGGFAIDGTSLAFDITTSASYTAPVKVCFNVPPVTGQTAAQFAALKVLHGENGVLVDRTLSHDFALRSICASVSSLSPFLVATNLNPPNTNEIDDPSRFVRQHYLDFLNREPDPPGFNGWLSTLNNCAPGDTTCDRVHVSQAFFQSDEFQQRGYFIYRFYSTAFGSKPDYVVFEHDFANVSGFLTNADLEAAKVAFIDDFMSRPAFDATYSSLSNQNYVDALLTSAGVTLSTRQSMIDGLNNATLTRAQVLRQIVESSTVYQKYYNQAFVVMEYFGYLHRDPDALYVNWIQVLNANPADARHMVDGFVNSQEYRQRFGPN